MELNYYETLNIKEDASAEEIKQAFIQLAKVYHPDKGGDEAKFKEINEAYQVLGSPTKKTEYDASGKTFDEQGGFNNGKNWDDFMHFANGQAVSMGSKDSDFDFDGLRLVFAGIMGKTDKFPGEQMVENVIDGATGGVAGNAMEAGIQGVSDVVDEFFGGASDIVNSKKEEDEDELNK